MMPLPHEPLPQRQLRTLTMLSVGEMEDLYTETSSRHEPGCENVEPACSNQAVRLLHMKTADITVTAVPEAACHCLRTMKVCLRCYDRYTQDGVVECAKCGGLMQIRTAEAL